MFSRGETVTLNIRKNTKKNKVSPLTGLQVGEKIMFFVIPEMPSKTFVMVKKNFLINLRFEEYNKMVDTETEEEDDPAEVG